MCGVQRRFAPAARGGTKMLAIHCLGRSLCSCPVNVRQHDEGVVCYPKSFSKTVLSASAFLDVRPRPRLLAGPWRQRRVQTASGTQSTILSTPMIV